MCILARREQKLVRQLISSRLRIIFYFLGWVQLQRDSMERLVRSRWWVGTDMGLQSRSLRKRNCLTAYELIISLTPYIFTPSFSFSFASPLPAFPPSTTGSSLPLPLLLGLIFLLFCTFLLGTIIQDSSVCMVWLYFLVLDRSLDGLCGFSLNQERMEFRLLLRLRLNFTLPQVCRIDFLQAELGEVVMWTVAGSIGVLGISLQLSWEVMVRLVGFFLVANLLISLFPSSSCILMMVFFRLILRRSLDYPSRVGGTGVWWNREWFKLRLNLCLRKPSKVRLRVALMIGTISYSLTLLLPLLAQCYKKRDQNSPARDCQPDINISKFSFFIRSSYFNLQSRSTFLAAFSIAYLLNFSLPNSSFIIFSCPSNTSTFDCVYRNSN